MTSSCIAPFCKTAERTVSTKKLQKNKFFRCFFAPDFLAQNSTRIFCSVSAPEKKDLSHELLINWEPEKKD